MSSRLEQFAQEIVFKLDCSQVEKEDMYEEMLIHLEISRDELLKQGYPLKEAENLAIQQFGNVEIVSSELQQVFTPYRKEMYLTFAFASLIWTITIYLMQLFTNGDAHIFWLMLAFACGTAFLILALLPLTNHLRKRYQNSLLVMSLLVLIYEYLMANSLNHTLSSSLAFGTILLIMTNVFFLYQTNLTGTSGKMNTDKKAIHFINITSGLIIGTFSLFFIWAGFALFGKLQPKMLLFASPLIIWSGLYKLQLVLWNKNRTFSYIIAIIPFFLSLIVATFIFAPEFFL
ncbi:permease prefix domain 1-containing protein [Bacillus sp. Hm123]|uniref:permease prefix domain 1-containing protein n=1 Tax=Bacillus sp. Hm123 TaxID=3450745 RepID=UPI003F42AE56